MTGSASADPDPYAAAVMIERAGGSLLSTTGAGVYGSLRAYLVPEDWLDGIGVERGVAFIRERLVSWN
jgi:hypothetical protein